MVHGIIRLSALPLLAVAVLLIPGTWVSAEPYTFTQRDFIEYGIYFSAGRRDPGGKLLTIRFGDIRGYYAEYLPFVKVVPTVKQRLRLKTSRGTVLVNRNDNEGLSVMRDTWNERKRTGTKRLEVRFEHGICIGPTGTSSACSVDLTLATGGPDKGVVRARRALTIKTSTGLSFTYRTRLRDGGRPYTPADFRAPVVNNYAWEWRPQFEG